MKDQSKSSVSIRNYGHHHAMMAAVEQAKGEFIFLIVLLSLFFLHGCTSKPQESDTNKNRSITYWGELDNFGIGFLDNPNYIELKEDLSINDLTDGSDVLLTRHTTRDSAEGPDLWALDRNGTPGVGASLNKQGIEEAETIHHVLKTLNIPIGEVYSSPTHRTTQLARIGFGSFDFTEKIELIYQPMMRIEEKALFDVELIRLLSAPIKGNGNRVLTAHNNTLERLGIRGVPTVKLQQGDTAVFKPLGHYSFKYLGTIEIEEWQTLSAER